MEDSLSELSKHKPRPPINAKELDTFAPLGFSTDFMMHPALSAIGQLDTIDFAPPKEVHAIKKEDLCRKRDSAEPLRPQKKIRTTFAVNTTKSAVKEEALVKSEQTVAAKEPVKVARKRKNNRERQRRQGLNQKFQALIEVLALQDSRNAMRVGGGSKGPKWNKHDILAEAIHEIKNLRTRLTGAEGRLQILSQSVSQ